MRLTHLFRPALALLVLPSIVPAQMPHQELGPARLQPRCQPPRGASVVDVRRDFGAVGDGIADDTSALQAAAAFVNANPGTTLYFPPGRYHVGQYAVDWFPDDSFADYDMGVKTACLFLGATDFKVIGCNAVIDVLGSYLKTPGDNAWTPEDPRHFARETHFFPFVFLNCSNFEIRGLELDGNADQLDVTPGIVWLEQFEQGILTADCSDYRISNVVAHHFPTDGLLLGTGQMDARVRVEQVESHHNGRDALSLIQMREATVEDCILRDSGDTQGPWPGLSPAAGLNVEPDCSLEPGECPGFIGNDQILLQRLLVLDNHGTGVGFAHGKNTFGVTLRDSLIVAPDESTAWALLLGARDSVVENCDIFAERGPVGLISDAPDLSQVSLRFESNRVTGHGLLFYGTFPLGHVLIRANEFTGDFTGPIEEPLFLSLGTDAGTDWQILDNVVRFPAVAAPLDARYFIGMSNIAAMLGNQYVVEGGAPVVPFSIAYAGVEVAADWVVPAIAFEGYEDLVGKIGIDGSIVLP